MKISEFDINLEKITKIIDENEYKNILLQVPEGLKTNYYKIVDFIEERTNANIIISADPCFGACDIPNYDLKKLDIDLIIHIGHTSIPNVKNTKIKTYFINAESDLDITNVIKKAIPKINGKKIGLVSTSQHIHLFDKIKKILIDNNFEPIVGKGDKRIELKGQILGCNFSAAKNIEHKVDCFLYIGSGNFHPLGLTLISKKQVILCDPYKKVVRDRELIDLKDMILRQRYGAIARSRDAQVFGIIIGTKLGQQRIELAYEIKQKLDSKNKKSYIFTIDHFTASFLESFRNINCFVSTACPRIAIDDYMQYKIPILTPIELDILLGFKKWEDYKFDEILTS
ncbi:diphthamide biosynthesis protein [Thermoplasmatales archaeon SG8-52-2]|nr:MAG: diphthamide biosynthesis protein [Thermoplasmatales archaeon SG8-52-2]